MPTDIEPEHIAGLEDIQLSLTSIHDKSPVTIWFSGKNETKIITENMDLAGDLIHSLANFLNIEDLKVYNKNIFLFFEIFSLSIQIISSIKFPRVISDDSLFSKHY